MKSSAFATDLQLRDANSNVIARGADIEASNDSRIRAIMRPGTYQLVAAADRAGDTGPFSLSIGKIAPVPSDCDPLFVSKGDSTSGQLLPVNCNGVSLGNLDVYRLHLAADETLQVHLRDLSYSGFDIHLQADDGTPLTSATPGLTYLDYNATYTAPRDMDLLIKVSSGDNYADYWITFK